MKSNLTLILVLLSCFLWATHLLHKNHIDLIDFQLCFRFYDPKVGRFMAADSIVPEPADGNAFNRYAYTYNNPVRFKDPSGHVPNDWLKKAWEHLTSSLGWGGGSSSYTSYGYTREDFLYGQAMNIDPQGVAQGVAGVAASTREFEFQVGAAYAAGVIDFYYYADSLFLYSRMQGYRPPSEALFEVVALDPASEPGYWIPYGLGLVTGAGTIVVPAGRSALGLLRQPRTAPAPQPHRPRYDPKHSPEIGPPYPLSVMGAAPQRMNFNDPRRYAHYPPGTLVHETHVGRNSVVDVLLPMKIRSGRPVRNFETLLFEDGVNQSQKDAISVNQDSATAGSKFRECILWTESQVEGANTVSGVVQKNGNLKQVDSNELIRRATTSNVIFPDDVSEN